MSKRITHLSRSHTGVHREQHRYEHWLVDNQIYFITSRCRDRFPAFANESAKQIFWTKFEQYTSQFGFTPWVTSLLDNHYHTLGHLASGENLPTMMQRIHGSVAKLVNDLLPQRFPDFWRNAKGKEYFDGCIRDEKQGGLAYRYTMLQGERHGIVNDFRNYPHTRIGVDIEDAVGLALKNGEFLQGVPYKRYQRNGPAR
jgi:REP element-mobilizing transposase RayT